MKSKLVEDILREKFEVNLNKQRFRKHTSKTVNENFEEIQSIKKEELCKKEFFEIKTFKKETKVVLKEKEEKKVNSEEFEEISHFKDQNYFLYEIEQILKGKSENLFKITNKEFFQKINFNDDKGYRMENELNISTYGNMLYCVEIFNYLFFYPLISIFKSK